MRVESVDTRVMGTTAGVRIVGGPPGAAGRAIATLHAYESRWSRFRPDSAISILNDRGCAVIDTTTGDLIAHAVAGARLSEWRFDPTVDVAALGYDRTFEDLAGHIAHLEPRPAGRRGSIVVEKLTDTATLVILPPGLRLDVGGIAKGYAADLIVGRLVAEGAHGVLVSIGGDVRAHGTDEAGDSWTIEIVEPSLRHTPFATIRLEDGAVATSTVARRAWRTDRGIRHHLVDPQTGDSHTGDVRLVSVIAGSGWFAEVLTKTLFTSPAPDPSPPALIVDVALSVTRIGDFARYEQ